GLMVKARVAELLRAELTAIGAVEFELPALQPAELWRASGRWNAIDTTMLRFRDRAGRELCLAMTHEELFASLARELRSYRDLPATWFQIARKYRDEPRPRGGLMRLREFTMKDSYSFALDAETLARQFADHAGAYRRIFERCGLSNVVVASADNGVMGGAESSEFLALSDEGEDLVALTPAGGCANLEVAPTLANAAPLDGDADAALDEPEPFSTPGVHTIDDLEAWGVPADRQAKTLVYVAQGVPVVALVRGDATLSEAKLARALGTSDVRPASEAEARGLMGSGFGSLGPVGLPAGTRVLADHGLMARRGLVSGANCDGFHLRGIDLQRDARVTYGDLRTARDGEPAWDGSGPLSVQRALEVGHIFKLGTLYSEALGVNVLDAAGVSRPVVMGSYGIGLDRLIAAVAARHATPGGGVVWPALLAPFTVNLIDLSGTSDAGRGLHDRLAEKGARVLWDDRDERAGVKHADADLLGAPVNVILGPRGLAAGTVEVRFAGATETVPLDEAAERAVALAAEA
ncbi:MAG TPA: proline--tRNA ligase, partial [Deinococcales bacterium]|nr:proline--tRNA ligase [Deinococcales bacterium]